MHDTLTRRRHRSFGWWMLHELCLAAAAAALVVVALRVALSPRLSLVAGVAAGLLTAGALAFWRDRRQRAWREREEAHARRIRQEASFRLFWESSADFESEGWARSALNTLALLSRNLPADAPLSPRLAARLAPAIAGVHGGVGDRLRDVLVTARDIEASPARIEALERAGGSLMRQLEGRPPTAGEAPRFEPRRVAAAVDATLEALDALREQVRPRIVSELGAVVSWIGRSRLAARVAAGELHLDQASLEAAGRVAVRPSDLSRALDQLLDEVFRQRSVEGTVDVRVSHEGEWAAITVSWPLRDRRHLEERDLLRPMRVLTAYGASVTLDERLDAGRVTLQALLPRVRVGA